jgi:plastocyanin
VAWCGSREASALIGVLVNNDLDRPMEDLIVSLRTASRAATRLAPKTSVPLLATVLVIGGCGSSSSSPTSASTSTPAAPPAGSGAHTLSLAASPEGTLKFEQTSLTAKAGSISIAFTNNASVEHNVTVASASGSVLGATATFVGGTKILPLNLKPGTYKFYCSVPGHRAAGMEGTLTVQ